MHEYCLFSESPLPKRRQNEAENQAIDRVTKVLAKTVPKTPCKACAQRTKMETFQLLEGEVPVHPYAVRCKGCVEGREVNESQDTRG